MAVPEFSSPRPGRYPGYARVIDDRDKAIFYAQLKPDPTFKAKEELLAARSRIKCVFPEEGRYIMQVWFFQAEGSDVLKGEVPFSVMKES